MLKTLFATIAAGTLLVGCATQDGTTPRKYNYDNEKTVEVNEAGEEIICRKDDATGSRIKKIKICGTQAEWDQIDEANDKHMKDMTKSWTNRQ